MQVKMKNFALFDKIGSQVTYLIQEKGISVGDF